MFIPANFSFKQLQNLERKALKDIKTAADKGKDATQKAVEESNGATSLNRKVLTWGTKRLESLKDLLTINQAMSAKYPSSAQQENIEAVEKIIDTTEQALKATRLGVEGAESDAWKRDLLQTESRFNPQISQEADPTRQDIEQIMRNRRLLSEKQFFLLPNRDPNNPATRDPDHLLNTNEDRSKRDPKFKNPDSQVLLSYHKNDNAFKTKTTMEKYPQQ